MFAPDGTDTVEPATMKCGAQAPCINLPGRKSSNRGMLNRCLDFVPDSVHRKKEEQSEMWPWGCGCNSYSKGACFIVQPVVFPVSQSGFVRVTGISGSELVSYRPVAAVVYSSGLSTVS